MNDSLLRNVMMTPHNQQPTVRHPLPRRFASGLLLLMTIVLAPGCAAFRPVRGVPASYMPVEFQAATREHRRTIDLGLLVRRPPDQHRAEAGDILAVFIPGVLGRWVPNPEQSIGEEPPINLPLTTDDPPTLGYPIQVRDDDTISLPQLPPLTVRGLTLHEIEEAIRRAYTVDRQILRSDPARIMVSLLRPREYRVLVVRQESQGETSSMMQGNTVNLGSTRRGIAREVRLRAYENDVMHALSRADVASGLPGLEAENTLYIIRNRRGAHACQPGFSGDHPPAGFMQIPAGEFGGHSIVNADHNTHSLRQDILLTGHQPLATHPIQPQPTLERYPAASFNGPNGYPLPMSAPAGAYPSNVQYLPPNSAPFHAHEPPPSLTPFPIEQIGPSTPRPFARDGHSMGQMPHVLPEQIGPGTPLLTASPADGQIPLDAWPQDLSGIDLTIDNPNVVKIPVRIGPGESPNLTEEDITLYDGDIVFIESRETEVFYTGGLLGGGQFTLPRDYDLNVLQAIAISQGQQNGGGGSQALQSGGGPSALNQDVIVSASRLVILRKLPCGNQVPIEVDLYRALRYPHENITVQAGDYLLLQYKFGEACAAFCQRNLLEGALIGIAASTFTTGQ